MVQVYEVKKKNKNKKKKKIVLSCSFNTKSMVRQSGRKQAEFEFSTFLQGHRDHGS